MGIEDRDWYREEYAKKHGRKAPHEWGRKKPLKGQRIGDFLEAERSNKDIYYDPKEFRGSKRQFSMKRQGVNKREKLKTVPVARFVRRSTALFAGFVCCITTAILTLFATLLIANTKPEYLELPIQYTVQLLNLVSRD